MITLGTGVGGGIIREGRIVAGVNGRQAGDRTYAMVDDESECCGCGEEGLLRAVCISKRTRKSSREIHCSTQGCGNKA